MFDTTTLSNWLRMTFVLSNRISPSEIDIMPYMEFKVFIMMYENWLEESKKSKNNA